MIGVPANKQFFYFFSKTAVFHLHLFLIPHLIFTYILENFKIIGKVG
jgi:hypothetical protein